jgi:hypothetical protein
MMNLLTNSFLMTVLITVSNSALSQDLIEDLTTFNTVNDSSLIDANSAPSDAVDAYLGPFAVVNNKTLLERGLVGLNTAKNADESSTLFLIQDSNGRYGTTDSALIVTTHDKYDLDSVASDYGLALTKIFGNVSAGEMMASDLEEALAVVEQLRLDFRVKIVDLNVNFYDTVVD